MTNLDSKIASKRNAEVRGISTKDRKYFHLTTLHSAFYSLVIFFGDFVLPPLTPKGLLAKIRLSANHGQWKMTNGDGWADD